MPPRSEAHRRWAHANKDRRGQEGQAARKYAEADKGGKLPERKGEKKGGRK